MTDDEFDALFDTVERSAFRYEGLPAYSVDDEDSDLLAWREGRAMTERSVRTDPWLRRIARQTVLHDVDWCRVRQTTSPPSWYLAWEINSYIESQAAGERVLLTGDRIWTGPDFWLFDADGPDARAILMHYDDDGAPTGHELVRGDPIVSELSRTAEMLIAAAVPLNRWIAEHRDELGGTGTGP